MVCGSELAAETVSELNDLIQLDLAAIEAYTAVIDAVEGGSLRESLRSFSRDHGRHVQELTILIEALGGSPVTTLRETGTAFRDALGEAARKGGDRAVVMLFRAKQMHIRDRYWWHADRPYPSEVRRAVRRFAEEEERHYGWASATLNRMQLPSRSPAAPVAR
jgi:rubrerythrin